MSACLQASRLDFCCCKTPRNVPPPSQAEGLLLLCFRKFYAPFLLHWFTRVVVVSGVGGAAGGPCTIWGRVQTVPRAGGSAQP